MTEPAPRILEFIKKHHLAVLATLRRSGPPPQTMLNYFFNGENYTLAANGSTLKVRNIRERPEVSLAIVDARRQVIVSGQATLVTDLDEVVRLHRELNEHLGRTKESVAEFRDRLRREERVVIPVRLENYHASLGPERGVTSEGKAR